MNALNILRLIITLLAIIWSMTPFILPLHNLLIKQLTSSPRFILHDIFTTYITKLSQQILCPSEFEGDVKSIFEYTLNIFRIFYNIFFLLIFLLLIFQSYMIYFFCAFIKLMYIFNHLSIYNIFKFYPIQFLTLIIVIILSMYPYSNVH